MRISILPETTEFVKVGKLVESPATVEIPLFGRVTTLLSFAVLRFHVLWFRNMHRQNNITLFRNINLVFFIIDEQTVLTFSTTVVLSSLTLRAIQSHSRRPSGRNAELEKAY